MLQTKSISFKGNESIEICSKIINKVSREYDEFTGYHINNTLEGLLLDFNVNNNYKDFNLTFIEEEVNDFEANKSLEFKVSYFDNQKDTKLKITIEKEGDYLFKIDSKKEGKIIDSINISKRVELNPTRYDIYVLDRELNKINNINLISSEKTLNISNLANYILENLGIKIGYLFTKSSKQILKKELERYFLRENK
ncbi:hypothetical protein [Clostridium mediterraneense]|uniref:hypothetical protein n=1 Tax=Clostridium mediterraneense TaxID=1805472 RepID=UPI00082C7069|nr:hypothetical protein [Clostridium mediterraneense]